MMVYTAASVRDVSVDADVLSGLTWLGQELWFADPERGQVVPVDPQSGRSGRALPCPGLYTGLATLHEHLLYAAEPDARIRVIDREDGRVVAELASPWAGDPVTAMEAGRAGLWLGFRDRLELRTTPQFGLAQTFPAPLGTTGVTVTDRYLLYSDRLGETITVVDLLTERPVLRINVDGRPAGLTWDGLRLWYCDATNIRLRAIEVPGLVSVA